MNTKINPRYLFLFLLIAIGAFVVINGASHTTTNNSNTKSKKTCSAKKETPSTTNEFISFDTFSRFLLISPNR